MFESHCTTKAIKAEKYFETLCKHFSKKVLVEKDITTARVHFQAGICDMKVDSQRMIFNCSAKSSEALATVEDIITSHVTKFSEFRDSTLHWSKLD